MTVFAGAVDATFAGFGDRGRLHTRRGVTRSRCGWPARFSSSKVSRSGAIPSSWFGLWTRNRPELVRRRIAGRSRAHYSAAARPPDLGSERLGPVASSRPVLAGDQPRGPRESRLVIRISSLRTSLVSMTSCSSTIGTIRTPSSSRTAGATSTGNPSIELTEEELAIAKREVERGRVVVRTPVEERDELGEIALRREDVTVERVPVAPAVRSQAYDRLSLPGAHAAPTSTSERQPAASARIEFGHIDNTKLRRLLFS
jgi:hypothetical protein